MKRNALLPIGFLCVFTLPAFSQYYFYNDRYYESDILLEATAGLGGMNAFTDLGGHRGDGRGFIKDLNLKNTKPVMAISLTATYRYAIALKAGLTAGSIMAYDSILKNVSSTTKRYARNLSFRSPVIELAALIEIHPLFIVNNENASPKLSPYLLGGIGFFSFNPQARLNNEWVNLHPLRLEGQGFMEYPERKQYALQQLCIPFGAGLRYSISSVVNARLEIIHRKLKTDYLDDVSTRYIDPASFSEYLSPQQVIIAEKLYDRRGELDPAHIPRPDERGDPTDNDAYFTVILKFGFVFRKRVR